MANFLFSTKENDLQRQSFINLSPEVKDNLAQDTQVNIFGPRVFFRPVDRRLRNNEQDLVG